MTLEKLNPKGHPTTPDQAVNLGSLCDAITSLEEYYGKEFIVTSGLRSSKEQERINPAVKNSAHRYGEAVDILDVDGSIDTWCIDNLDLLIRFGLYLESPTYTPRWCHLQIRQPKSGMRIFIP